MKRDKSLQPLSWQHHNELMSCVLIKKGVKKEADIVLLTDFTNTFWKDDLKKQITVEEEILIPFLVRHQVEDRYINMIRTDHSIFHSILERLNTFDQRHRVFEIFATLIEQHIRFKERILFGRMQETISEKELEELGLKLHLVQYKKCTDYPVKFWE
ncbi:MAG: hemerythrin domain-containing protein [Chitinophagaceae bacterium]